MHSILKASIDKGIYMKSPDPVRFGLFVFRLLVSRPERILKYWKKEPFLSDSYLSVGAKRAIPLFGGAQILHNSFVS